MSQTCHDRTRARSKASFDHLVGGNKRCRWRSEAQYPTENIPTQIPDPPASSERVRPPPRPRIPATPLVINQNNHSRETSLVSRETPLHIDLLRPLSLTSEAATVWKRWRCGRCRTMATPLEAVQPVTMPFCGS